MRSPVTIMFEPATAKRVGFGAETSEFGKRQHRPRTPSPTRILNQILDPCGRTRRHGWEGTGQRWRQLRMRWRYWLIYPRWYFFSLRSMEEDTSLQIFL